MLQIKKLQGDLEKVESNQSQLQMKNKGLKSDIEELEQQLEETEVNILRVFYLCSYTESSCVDLDIYDIDRVNCFHLFNWFQLFSSELFSQKLQDMARLGQKWTF